MNHFTKIIKIFDKSDKKKLAFLTVQLIIGAFFELIGITLFLPLIQVLISDDTTQSVIWSFFPKTCASMDVNKKIVFLCILMIAIYIVKNLFLAFSLYYQYKFIYDFQNRTRTLLLKRYLEKPYLFHTQNNSADMNRSLTSDVYNFSDYLIGIVQMISEGIVSIVLVLFLAYSDIVITLVILGLLAAISVCYFIPTRKRLIKNGADNQKAYSDFVKCMNQSWGSIKEIKMQKREDYFTNIFFQASSRYAETKRKVQFLSAFPRFMMESVVIVGFALAIIIRVMLGGNIVEMVSNLSVFAVAAYRLMPSVNRINAYYGMVSYNKASVDLVYKDLEDCKTLDRQSQTKICAPDCPNEHNITISGISFKYPEADYYVLKNINMSIEIGKSVGIVGKTGAGKTTLVDILLGLLKPDTGCVRYNGIDTQKNKDEWLKKVGYIPQKIYILDDTIRNNIAFGLPKEEIDDEQIWEALRAAQMDQFVNQLEYGLDTTVGECGARLSGGQCQRLGIARVLFKRPEIIVMDESTSALDNETEKAVMESIENLHGKVTLIIIAHRLTTVQKCDYIYEVCDGNVIQRQSDELI